MQHLNSAMPMILSPTEQIEQTKVPFFPTLQTSKFQKSKFQKSKFQQLAHAVSSVNHVRPSRYYTQRRLFNRVFAHKFFGLLGLLVPTTLMMSAAFYLPTLSAHRLSHDAAYAHAQALPTVSLQKIVQQKTLMVVTTQGESTYFGNDGFEHGFGYDVMNRYAQNLGVSLKTVVVDNEQQALSLLKQGQAEMVLTALPAANDDQLVHLNVACHGDFLATQGLSEHTAIVLPKADKQLVANVQSYLCDGQQKATHAQLAAFYTPHVFDNQYSQNKFSKTMATQLPSYRRSFQQSAKQHDLDWHLLVAMGYQESQLKPDAVSPTGVRGIMMLTNDTAEQMGVSDRIDPRQSIQGGAKFLKLLNQQFADIPESDRIWFTLAAYNMGPQAVRNIQDKLQLQGRNANSWAEVYAYMAQYAEQNSRYVQCMQYVTHIRGYLEVMKLGNISDKSISDKKVA